MYWRIRWQMRRAAVSAFRHLALVGRCYIGSHQYIPLEFDPLFFPSQRFLNEPPPGHPEKLCN
ncbi:hypothetical protein [Streptomyces mirabilis]|uniref:hypothetical protein n=1 Tax=Streptomyces mirabilis TaxID=68239 RepID=UPI003327ED17